jgi:hypothetical protein
MPSRRHVILPALLTALAVLLAAQPAAAAHSIRLKVPRFAVPAHSDREVCTFVRLPMHHPFDVSGQLVVNLGGSAEFQTHHFLMYTYNGASLDAFTQFEGKVVDSKACLDFGPADRNSRTLIGGSQQPRLRTRYQPGIAQQIAPGANSDGKAVGFILNSHWINGSDRVQHASVVIRLYPAHRHTVKRFLKQIFEATANGFIMVPPHTADSVVGWSWTPNSKLDFSSAFGGASAPKGPACVVAVSSHMHKRGKLFTVDFVDRDHSHTEIYRSEVYSDPGIYTLNPPLLVSPGQAISYTCTHDNGVTTPVKLGCEEQVGVPPGTSIASAFPHLSLTVAAKRCSAVGPDPTECPATDPVYAGRTFTGNCVEANLVFGFTSDDDMCILPGAYYDANPDAAPGQECDLGPLPVIN